MATKKTYAASSIRSREPIVFEINAGPEGVHAFRVPRKQRVDVVTQLNMTVQIDKGTGQRVYPNDAIRRALVLLIAQELWVPSDVQVEGEPEAGEWVEVDDRERFINLLNSPRVEVETQTLGEIVWDLVEELTGNPTTAPRP